MSHDPFASDDDDNGTVFRDVITLALCGFVAIVVLLLPHINSKVTAKESESAQQPGNVMVELRWPDEVDADIDLWVQAPGDIPVGYSNKGGAYFNLLRDDLGKQLDATDLNYEVAYSRGIPAGEYAVNVHAYRYAGPYPVPVRVVVSVRADNTSDSRQLLATKLELKRDGQELTAFRFRLNAKGELDEESVHNIYKPLRSGSK